MKVFIEVHGVSSSIKIFQLCLFCFLLLSVFVYFFIPELGRQGLWVGDTYVYSLRMTGLSGGANSLGEVATVFSLLCFWRIVGTDGNKIDYLFFVFGILVLFASWNKMGIASFLLGLLVIQSKKSPLYLVVGLSLVACFLLAIIVVGVDEIAVLLSRYGDANEVLSFTGRAYIWPVVIDSIINSPFFGNGFGVMFATDDKDSVGFVAAHAHNLILQCLSTVGFFGLFLFILSFCFCLRSSLLKKDYLLLALLSVIFFRGFTESGLFMGTPNASLIIWLWVVFLSEVKEFSNINTRNM